MHTLFQLFSISVQHLLDHSKQCIHCFNFFHYCTIFIGSFKAMHTFFNCFQFHYNIYWIILSNAYIVSIVFHFCTIHVFIGSFKAMHALFQLFSISVQYLLDHLKQCIHFFNCFPFRYNIYWIIQSNAYIVSIVFNFCTIFIGSFKAMHTLFQLISISVQFLLDHSKHCIHCFNCFPLLYNIYWIIQSNAYIVSIVFNFCTIFIGSFKAMHTLFQLFSISVKYLLDHSKQRIHYFNYFPFLYNIY